VRSGKGFQFGKKDIQVNATGPARFKRPGRKVDFNHYALGTDFTWGPPGGRENAEYDASQARRYKSFNQT